MSFPLTSLHAQFQKCQYCLHTTDLTAHRQYTLCVNACDAAGYAVGLSALEAHLTHEVKDFFFSLFFFLQKIILCAL